MPKNKERRYRHHRNNESDSGSSRDTSPQPEYRKDRRERGDDRGRKERDRRHRSRSKSRDRHRRRSRSPSRERSHKKPERRHRSKSRDRIRRRSRSRSRSPTRTKDKSKRNHRDPPSSTSEQHRSTNDTNKTESAKPTKSEDNLTSPPTNKSEDKEVSIIDAVKAEQQKIEEAIQKRRERLEAWRQKMVQEDKLPEAEGMADNSEEAKEDTEKKKGWSLEDDDEDDVEEDTMETEDAENEDNSDESEKAEKMETEKMETEKMETEEPAVQTKVEETKVEDDVDPLDAFMVGVQEEVNEIKNQDHKKAGAKLSGKKGGATMITVTKVRSTGHHGSKKKGELMHNDQDAAEYSEEEYNENEELASALLSIAKKNKKKDLPQVDHKKVEYAPFRKDFYVEVPELAKMTQQDVVARRRELENIKVKGKNCPHPIKTFPQSGLSKKILDVMKRAKYETPTPIQAQAIPAIMSGRDLIGIARTGSGKTLAFLLPMFRHILDQPPLEYEDGPHSIILAPTRELAIQIYSECKKFCKYLKLRPVCVYGGTGISEQIADLKRGAEIIICTPGRMIDMLAANNGRVTNLRRVTYIVLDEADRMFDLGFEPQVSKIIDNVRPDRQTVMFSATFPRQMEALARKILSKPIEVQVGGRSVVSKDVHQSVIVLESHQKYFKLLELLGLYQEKGSILVFVERQETADTLIRDLMKSSYVCMALHGGMDQFDRDSTIADFKNGIVKIMVATSVAARGLDVKQLVLVVNYDCPNHYEDYVHRCGRTGRAGNKGNAYTFITSEQQKVAGDIIKALELSKVSVPSELEDLWTGYTDKLKAEGKLVKGKITFKKRTRKAIGFGGSGYKFDEKEAIKDSEAKLKQKSALGMADDDDEDQYALLTMDKKLDEVFGGKVKVDDPTGNNFGRPALLPTPPQSERLDLATAIAEKIVQSKNLVVGGVNTAAQQAATSIMKGEEVKVTGAALASQIAASINAKVGASPANVKDTFLPVGAIVPGQQPISGEATDDQFLKYSDEIEINGFPQQIRFRLTTREVLDDIGEYSDSYISVRGIYIPESRRPNVILGERRLYLSIEGKAERAIQLAKQEIKRVIKEAAQRMATRAKPAQHTGRYSVL